MHIFINLAEYFIEHIEHFCRYFQIKEHCIFFIKTFILENLTSQLCFNTKTIQNNDREKEEKSPKQAQFCYWNLLMKYRYYSLKISPLIQSKLGTE